MKKCYKCKIKKELKDFNKNKSNKDGLQSKCRSCFKLYNYKNKLKIKLNNKKYYENNKEVIKENSRINRKNNPIRYYQYNVNYRINNKDKIKRDGKLYARNNKHVINHNNSNHRAKKLQATPKWLTGFDLEYIKNIYTQSSELTRITGIKYNVDHIVPLNSKLVCGLHVPWNLQVIEQSENIKKSNKILKEYL